MKSQQGFVVFGGIVAWLVAAGVAGTFVVAVDQLPENKAAVATQSQDKVPLMLSAATDTTLVPATPAASTGPQTSE